jgi:hypothetical protein
VHQNPPRFAHQNPTKHVNGSEEDKPVQMLSSVDFSAAGDSSPMVVQVDLVLILRARIQSVGLARLVDVERRSGGRPSAHCRHALHNCTIPSHRWGERTHSDVVRPSC